MPATTNRLAKGANGIGDDLLSTLVLAADCPVMFVPAMSGVMWNKAAIQRNVTRLENDGYYVVPPADGFSVSGGQVGIGAMADVITVMFQLKEMLAVSARRRATSF